MTCGVYSVYNTVTRKQYIGASTNIERRWETHRKLLRARRKKPNPKFQNAWNKYGEAAFRFTILQVVPVAMLAMREQHWINSLRADQLYNTGRKQNRMHKPLGAK